MPVPQTVHFPFSAFFLFAISTSCASAISLFALHFTQYPSATANLLYDTQTLY